MQMGWRRLHRPLRGAKAITIVSTLTFVSAIVLIYAFLFGAGDAAFTVAMYAAIGAILLSVWAWRRWSYGVFVGARGIRITYASGTMFFAGRDITGIQARHSAEPGPAARPSTALWIETTDGTAVQTPVVRGCPRIGRYSLDRPARLYLSEPVFDAMVIELNAEFWPRQR